LSNHEKTRHGRTLAIGDVHGHVAALRALVDLVQPAANDTLVLLGDYIDQGPDSRGVLEFLLSLEGQCRLAALMGNHEELLLAARRQARLRSQWLDAGFGGQATLDSYNAEDLSAIDEAHVALLERLARFHETDSHFFIHANYAANWRLSDHDSRTALWRFLDDLPGPHYSGKTAIVGHTPQMSGRILDHGYLKCIDTGCGYGGCLTALDVDSDRLWQVYEDGRSLR
jgi:serine/threonine protein phosphatase 1